MDKAFEQEILALEKQFWKALQDKDVATATRLTHDPCIITGAQGASTIDLKTFRELTAKSPWTIVEFAISDASVLRLGNDVAVIAYKVREKLTVNGKALTLEAADASTWFRKNGSWVCAMHCESVLGDPFGRDRQTA